MWFGEGEEALRKVSREDMYRMGTEKRFGMYAAISSEPETHFLDLKIDSMCKGWGISRFDVSCIQSG